MCVIAHRQTLYQQHLVWCPPPIPLHQPLKDCSIQMREYIHRFPIETRYLEESKRSCISPVVSLIPGKASQSFPSWLFSTLVLYAWSWRQGAKKGHISRREFDPSPSFNRTQWLTLHAYDEEGSRHQSSEQRLHSFLRYFNIWIIIWQDRNAISNVQNNDSLCAWKKWEGKTAYIVILTSWIVDRHHPVCRVNEPTADELLSSIVDWKLSLLCHWMSCGRGAHAISCE